VDWSNVEIEVPLQTTRSQDVIISQRGITESIFFLEEKHIEKLQHTNRAKSTETALWMWKLVTVVQRLAVWTGL